MYEILKSIKVRILGNLCDLRSDFDTVGALSDEVAMSSCTDGEGLRVEQGTLNPSLES